jgi:hypothetical protein
MAIDISGSLFGQLTAKTRVSPVGSHDAQWLCACTCGATKIVSASNLLNGRTRSCGCMKQALMRAKLSTHGGRYTSEYNCWCSMKSRCLNTRNRSYPRYGGRGIVVCARWRDSFAAFLEDMGRRPPHHTLERRNNDGPYAPENVYWATARAQNNNTRRNLRLAFRGITHTAAEWTRIFGLPEYTVKNRLRRGWSVERALLTPVR